MMHSLYINIYEKGLQNDEVKPLRLVKKLIMHDANCIYN